MTVNSTSRFEWGYRMVDGSAVIPAMNRGDAERRVAAMPTHDRIGPLRRYEVVVRTVTTTPWEPIDAHAPRDWPRAETAPSTTVRAEPQVAIDPASRSHERAPQASTRLM